MPFVQGTTKTVTGVSSTTLAYGSNVGAGSLLTAGVSMTALNITSITDNLNAGNWNADVSINTTGTANDIDARSRVGTAAGACTATYNFSTGINAGINQEEYSGVATSAPLDKTSTAEASGSTLVTTSVTPTQNGELILSVAAATTASETISNSTSGWTVRENTSPNAQPENQVATADLVQGTAAAVTTTWSFTVNQDHSAVVATYKAAPAAAATLPPGHLITPRLGPRWELYERAFMSKKMAVFPIPTAAPVTPIFSFGTLKRTTTTPRGRAFIAPVAAVQIPPTLQREQLVRVVATPRGRANRAPVAPAPARPTTVRERLVALVRTPVGRGRVAGPGPVQTPPTLAVERLVRVVPTPRGRAKLGAVGPAQAPPTTARERLVRTPPALLGRARVAAAAVTQAAPTQAVQRLVKTQPSLARSRAVVLPVIQILPTTMRTSLKFPVRVVRGAQARVAAAAVPQAPPLQAFTKLKLTSPALRGRARVAPVIPVALVTSRTALKQPVRVVRGAISRVAAAAVPQIPPTRAFTKLRITPPAFRSRASVAPVIAIVPTVARTALKQPVRVVKGGRGLVAAAAVAALPPVTNRLNKTFLKFPFPALRSRASVAPISVIPPTPPVVPTVGGRPTRQPETPTPMSIGDYLGKKIHQARRRAR